MREVLVSTVALKSKTTTHNGSGDAVTDEVGTTVVFINKLFINRDFMTLES